MEGNTTGKVPDGLIPFFDQYPKSGNCEFKQFGEVLGIKELGNAIFSLLDVVVGLFGVITFRNIDLLPEYMFGLVAGYGIANAVYSARLWYGCSKINSLIVNAFDLHVISACASTSLLFGEMEIVSKNHNKYYCWIVSLLGLHNQPKLL